MLFGTDKRLDSIQKPVESLRGNLLSLFGLLHPSCSNRLRANAHLNTVSHPRTPLEITQLGLNC